MAFPAERPRRLRDHAVLREMVAETRVTAMNLIMPLFVREGQGERRPIGSMPGQFQFSSDTLVEKAREVAGAGVPAPWAVSAAVSRIALIKVLAKEIQDVLAGHGVQRG